MGKRFSDRIIEFLQRPGYEPVEARRLARVMGIAEAEYGDFHDAVDALRRLGRVVLGTNNAVMLPHPPQQVIGTFRANPRGFGFVVPDAPAGHGDLYIAPGSSLDALTGDKVLCAVVHRGKRAGKVLFGGRILRVIERGQSRFVGELRHEGKMWYVKADGHVLHAPILIGDPAAKAARAGDQVVVEITRYPSDGSPARGVIVERLGKRGAPGVDLLGVIRQFMLPDEFPATALDEARGVVRAFDSDAAAAKREDLSARTIITIDPDDARDFDDAISLERMAPGARTAEPPARRRGHRHGAAAWELGVHIADVSAFVRAGGPLDAEAHKRGTSVYFPGHVLPMLPEVLSNGLCSLQEGEPRLCKSAFIRYDAEANVVGARFANTVIRSAKRLTYREAQSILDGRKPRFPKPVCDLVRRMDTLARAIRARRLRQGMIVLDLPAIDLVLDVNGQVVDARPEDKSFTHTIIEMLMVEANEAVARLLAASKTPFLRRIHPEPDDAALEAMTRFAGMLGEKLPKRMTPRDLQRLLDHLRGRPEGYAVNLAVLKSMQMAEYSPETIGHFALASEAYAHFTSPIRRYPDLMVHRLLESHLDGAMGRQARSARAKRGIPGLQQLVEEGRRMSYLARRAESAERELKELKVLTLLSGQVGETFEGVITGVTNFGLFVQHPKYLIDGLLRLEDLGDDWWETDVGRGRVVGERSRRAYSLGSRIAVRIAAVDLGLRELSLSPAAGVSTKRPAKAASGGSPPTKRRRRGNNGARRPTRAAGWGRRRTRRK